MIECLIVAFGGAIGAVLRYLIGLIPLSQKSGFPIKTFLINVIGCFIISILVGIFAVFGAEKLIFDIK